MESAQPRRRYHSQRRTDEAERTRNRILRAAGELFEDRGFAATTIAAIAERAGVSAPTIYAGFGSKAKLVRALVETMEVSADARSFAVQLEQETDPHALLRIFARWTAAFFTAGKPQLAVLGELGTEAQDLAAEGNAHRRAALESLIPRLGADLREDLTATKAVDRAWILTGLETYLNAVSGCGWSSSEFGEWLGDTLIAQLLTPRSPDA